MAAVLDLMGVGAEMKAFGLNVRLLPAYREGAKPNIS